MITPLKKSAGSNTFENLDIVRGIAAASVFLHHYAQQFPQSGNGALKFFERLGGWGVTIFFVLSGFCIHWSEINSRNNGRKFNAKSYFTRRFFRIYPAFVVCLVVCFIISQYHTANNINKGDLWALFDHLTLTSSFSVENRNAINTVLWTVVVEAHFYILYALLQRFFNGLKPALGMVAVSTGVAVIAYVASVTLADAGHTRIMLQKIFATSWWIWCLGAFAAELIQTGHPLVRQPWLRRGILIGSIAASLLILFLPPGLSLQAVRFVLPAIVFVGMLMILKSQTPLVLKPLKFLGEVSYSLYLFHPVALLIGTLFVMNDLGHFVSIMTLGLIIAVLGYRFIEKPLNDVGHRLAKKMTAKQSGSSAKP